MTIFIITFFLNATRRHSNIEPPFSSVAILFLSKPSIWPSHCRVRPVQSQCLTWRRRLQESGPGRHTRHRDNSGRTELGGERTRYRSEKSRKTRLPKSQGHKKCHKKCNDLTFIMENNTNPIFTTISRGKGKTKRLVAKIYQELLCSQEKKGTDFKNTLRTHLRVKEEVPDPCVIVAAATTRRCNACTRSHEMTRWLPS